jgi:hypothetical protein
MLAWCVVEQNMQRVGGVVPGGVVPTATPNNIHAFQQQGMMMPGQAPGTMQHRQAPQQPQQVTEDMSMAMVMMAINLVTKV